MPRANRIGTEERWDFICLKLHQNKELLLLKQLQPSRSAISSTHGRGQKEIPIQSCKGFLNNDKHTKL